MSSFMPRRARAFDPLTEHLMNLQPEQVDALEMMRGIYSNQIALSAAILGLQRHSIINHHDVYGLGESVAANTLPRFQAVKQELETQPL
ncbi:hypothetical protein HRJ45_24180 [Vibrio coralliilyticus]|nr:hypothetical protein [Vibrio coralliilyticus]NRF82211.1 hypothetical protein [Vibrio coralliilyticus]